MVEYDCSLLLTGLGLTGVLLLINWWNKNRGLPPGPLGFPIVGYYPFLTKKPYIQLKDLANRYGDILSFRTTGGHLIIVFSKLEDVKDLLVNRAEEFIGRPLQANFLHWVDGGLGIAQEEGQPWKEQRRFFSQNAKIFGFGKIEIEGLVQDLTQQLVEDIKKLNGKPFEPLVHVSHITCNVISHILFRKQFSKNDESFQTIMKGLDDLASFFTDNRFFVFGIFMKWMIKFSSVAKKTEAVKEKTFSLISDIVNDHVRAFNPQNLQDFVDAFLDHMKKLEEKGQLHGSSFTWKRLDAIATDMFMEGTASVAAAICCLLAELSKHEDAQRKAQEEIDSVVEKQKFPSWLDRAKLPYFNAVIQELFRTDQPFSLSTYYSNFRETRIKGFRIPKRSIIIANLYAMNNDPVLFPNPSKFEPERFIDASGNRLKQEGPFPFGIGKRSCIGEPLAQIEIFLVLAIIMQNFTLYASSEGKIRAVPR